MEIPIFHGMKWLNNILDLQNVEEETLRKRLTNSAEFRTNSDVKGEGNGISLQYSCLENLMD